MTSHRPPWPHLPLPTGLTCIRSGSECLKSPDPHRLRHLSAVPQHLMRAAHALLLLEEDPRIVTSESVTIERSTGPTRSIVRHKFNTTRYAAAAALGLLSLVPERWPAVVARRPIHRGNR